MTEIPTRVVAVVVAVAIVAIGGARIARGPIPTVHRNLVKVTEENAGLAIPIRATKGRVMRLQAAAKDQAGTRCHKTVSVRTVSVHRVVEAMRAVAGDFVIVAVAAPGAAMAAGMAVEIQEAARTEEANPGVAHKGHPEVDLQAAPVVSKRTSSASKRETSALWYRPALRRWRSSAGRAAVL